MDNIWKSPRTTWAGVAGAFGAALLAWSHGQLDAGAVGGVIMAVSSLVMGAVAKDGATHSTTQEVRAADAAAQ